LAVRVEISAQDFNNLLSPAKIRTLSGPEPQGMRSRAETRIPPKRSMSLMR
jgi:hypothetical protein